MCGERGVGTKRIAAEIGVKEPTVHNVHWKVKKLGLLPGMTTVPQASSSSSPSSPSSPQERVLLTPQPEEIQPVKLSPLERGVGGVEDILPDDEEHPGTQRVTEERSSAARANSSERTTEEPSRNAVPENSLRKEGDSSERMRNSSVPQTGSSDSSKSSSGRTEETLGVFAEEVEEMRKTVEFLRESTGVQGR